MSKDSLYLSRKSVPAAIAENDDLWINEAAQKRYRLNMLSDFRDDVIVANTTATAKKAPRIKGYPTWTKKRIFALLGANAAVLFVHFLAGDDVAQHAAVAQDRRRGVVAARFYCQYCGHCLLYVRSPYGVPMASLRRP